MLDAYGTKRDEERIRYTACVELRAIALELRRRGALRNAIVMRPPTVYVTHRVRLRVPLG